MCNTKEGTQFILSVTRVVLTIVLTMHIDWTQIGRCALPDVVHLLPVFCRKKEDLSVLMCKPSSLPSKTNVGLVGLWCLTSLSTFSYIMVVSFIGGGNKRKPPTCHKSLTNFYHVMLYWVRTNNFSGDRHWLHR